MKIKDLDEDMLDYYCAMHVCEECPLNKISEERCCSCFKLLDLLKGSKDVFTEISILTKEEWLYLKAVIDPFRDRAQDIKIANGIICINILPNQCCKIIKCFEFKSLIEYKPYTLQELDL